MAIGKAMRIGKRAYLLITVATLATLAGCSAGGSSSTDIAGTMGVIMPGPSGPLETHAITVEAVPTADEVGLYVAADRGYFQQEGLTVTIKPTGGGELAIPDLRSGATDLVAGNYVSFVQAEVTHEADLRMIADGSLMQPGNQAIYVMPGSKIKTVADLAKHHATIGVNTLHNVGSVLIGGLLRDNGYSLNNVTLVPGAGANPFGDLLSKLASHKIDAAWLPEPFATIAEENLGAVELADFDQGSLQNFPIGVYIGTKTWVTSHPNTVAAFLHALQEGQEVADTSRSEVENVLVKYTLVPNGMSQGEAAQIASLLTLDSYPLAMDVPTMQRVSDAMFEFGLEPGYTQPYNMLNMIQPEPGMVR